MQIALGRPGQVANWQGSTKQLTGLVEHCNTPGSVQWNERDAMCIHDSYSASQYKHYVYIILFIKFGIISTEIFRWAMWGVWVGVAIPLQQSTWCLTAFVQTCLQGIEIVCVTTAASINKALAFPCLCIEKPARKCRFAGTNHLW